MAFAQLSTEALYLKGMGLSYVLMPGPCPQSPAAPPVSTVHRPPPATGRGAARPAAQRTWHPAQRQSVNPPAAKAERLATPQPDAPVRQPSCPRFPMPERWPASWSALLANTKPGRVAWTYYGLGHDLLGSPSAARRERLAALIRYLALPAGTHTFWPVGLPEPDEDGKPIIVPSPEIFWDGLRRLGARVLIVLGSPAARCIGVTGPIRPMFSPMQAFNGVRLLITWDIDSLDDPAKMNGSRTFLRTMLTSLL